MQMSQVAFVSFDTGNRLPEFQTQRDPITHGTYKAVIASLGKSHNGRLSGRPTDGKSRT